MKIPKMYDGVRLFLWFSLIFALEAQGLAFCASTSSALSSQETDVPLSRSSGVLGIGAGYTSPGQGAPYYTQGMGESYEAPRFTRFQKVLVAEMADTVPGGPLLPETHLPEQAPLEQSVLVPLPGPDTLPLAETGDGEVLFSPPPTVPRNEEPPLPPAPEPSSAGIGPPVTVLPPASPPAESLELPPVLEPSIADLMPAAELVPSVSAPPALLPEGSTEPKVSALPEPTLPQGAPPPGGSPPGSIITVRPFTPPPEKTPAPVQAPPSSIVEPAPVQTPEPPRFIRPAEPEPVPQIARQVLPQGAPIQEPPAQGSSPVFPGERQAKAAYSRNVQVIVGQMVEIPFRGTGWVYLGEQESQAGIVYNSRYLEKEGQTFVFQTESPGTYTLTFYKQDFIEDYIVNDAVQVIVNPIPQVSERSRTSRLVDPGRVIAEPRWPTLPGAAGPDRQAAPSIQQPLTELPPATVTSPETPPAPLPPIDYLQQAREAYTAGQFPQAISSLDLFREQYPAGTDEAWWLYGQSLEAASSSRDIRSALDYYHRLIREYPQSLRGNDARRRIAYLERYYFTIQ